MIENGNTIGCQFNDLLNHHEFLKKFPQLGPQKTSILTGLLTAKS